MHTRCLGTAALGARKFGHEKKFRTDILKMFENLRLVIFPSKLILYEPTRFQ